MIGLDTNVLLRLWLNDEPAHAPRVEALLTEHGQGMGSLLVTDVVLAEALWVLASAYCRRRIGISLGDLLLNIGLENGAMLPKFFFGVSVEPVQERHGFRPVSPRAERKRDE